MRKIFKSMSLVILLLTVGCLTQKIREEAAETAEAIGNLSEEIVELEIADDDTILLTFRFSNPSPLEVVLIRITFNLYANEHFLGNFSMVEEKILSPGETIITITADIHPLYLEDFQSEKEHSDEILWLIIGGFVIQTFEDMNSMFPFEETWVTK